MPWRKKERRIWMFCMGILDVQRIQMGNCPLDVGFPFFVNIF
jgi:hypothetical protein